MMTPTKESSYCPLSNLFRLSHIPITNNPTGFTSSCKDMHTAKAHPLMTFERRTPQRKLILFYITLRRPRISTSKNPVLSTCPRSHNGTAKPYPSIRPLKHRPTKQNSPTAFYCTPADTHIFIQPRIQSYLLCMCVSIHTCTLRNHTFTTFKRRLP